MKLLRVLHRLDKLLKHGSPSKKEGKVAKEIIRQLEELNIEIFVDSSNEKYGGEVGNIFAALQGNDNGNGKPVTFNAHMDTVETEEFPLYEVKDGRICSKGEYPAGLDDKAGIAAVIEAAAILKEKNLKHRKVNILLTAAEEIGLLGAKNFNYEKIKDSFVFVVDSHGTPGIIINKAPSQTSLDVTIIGKSAHSGVEPEKGKNSILAASKAIANMHLGRIDDDTTANVGTINGGLARNIIPETTKIKAEARSHDSNKLLQQVEHMIGCFVETSKSLGCVAGYDVIDEYRSFFWDGNSEIVEMAKEAITKSGLTPFVKSTGGGSDTNIINSSGVPAIALSCGYHNPHSSDEYANIEDLQKTVDILVNLATL